MSAGHARAALAACALLLAGCAATAPPGGPRPSGFGSPGFGPSGSGALLVRDGATVAVTFESGPGRAIDGSLGTGRLARTYDAGAGTLGPDRVVSHTPRALVFATGSTTCTLATEGVATCADGTRGSWNAI